MDHHRFEHSQSIKSSANFDGHVAGSSTASDSNLRSFRESELDLTLVVDIALDDDIRTWGFHTLSRSPSYDSCAHLESLQIPDVLSSGADGQERPHGFDLESVVLKLLQRTYWYRMWIVQEILLAKSITIFCGQSRIEWDSFEELIERFKHAVSCTESDSGVVVPTLSPRGCLSQLSTTRFSKFAYQRRIFADPPLIMPLKELIETYGDGRCTDPRDRIYSLLGLCRSGSAGHRLSADYNQSALGLFFETLDVCDAAIPVLLGRKLRAILQLNDDLYGRTADYLSQAIEKARSGTLDAEMQGGGDSVSWLPA